MRLILLDPKSVECPLLKFPGPKEQDKNNGSRIVIKRNFEFRIFNFEFMRRSKPLFPHNGLDAQLLELPGIDG